jgi:ABC-type molybdate transport system permease subunit
MNPLELLYSWHGILIACMVVGLTQLLKSSLDVAWGKFDETPTPTMGEARKVGEELRRKNVILNRVIMPVAPLVIGFLLAILIPVHPEVLIEYVNEHVAKTWQHYMIFGAWGAACGSFADYTFSKAKGVFGDVVSSRRSRETSPPPAAPAKEDE